MPNIIRALSRVLALVLAFSGLFGVLAGCNQTTRYYAFSLEGSITLASGQSPDAPVVIELYHARAGEGELAYPLRKFAEYKLDKPGPFKLDKIEYPTDLGEGLVIYAWLDQNKDGALCSPTTREEPAGLIEATAFPARTITVNLTLQQLCLGPEAFYPAP